MTIDPNPGTRSLAAGLSCVVLVGLSIALVDRPVSTFSHATFRGAWEFVYLTHIVDLVLPGSVLGLIVAAVAVMSGWRPGPIGRTVIACCLAALLAYAIKDQLKYAFGRLWPETWVNNNPSWIANGAYGFAPFHGGAGWSSFPSGHMAGITAPMTVLWLRAPKLRWIAGLLTGLVAIGLVGADYHFVGDIIAGTYVGAGSAIGMLAALHAGWSRHDDRGDGTAEIVLPERRRGSG